MSQVAHKRVIGSYSRWWLSLFFFLHFFLSFSANGCSYLTEIPTFDSAVQTERFPGFRRYSWPPGGISPAMPLDWLNASLSYFFFSLSWISMAHSPCWEHRAQGVMEGEQDGKILCQLVNLYEAHKEPKEIDSWRTQPAQKSRRAYKERTEAIKGKNELIWEMNLLY